MYLNQWIHLHHALQLRWRYRKRLVLTYESCKPHAVQAPSTATLLCCGFMPKAAVRRGFLHLTESFVINCLHLRSLTLQQSKNTLRVIGLKVISDDTRSQRSYQSTISYATYGLSY